MGKELRSTFLEAGFSDIQTSASFDFFATAEDVAFLHAFIVDWFFSPDVTSAATKYGFATQEQLDQWRQNLDSGRATPGRAEAFAFGEVIARKPQS